MNWLEGLNEPQREAVEHRDGPLLVLAGAGSGKTRVITSRVAHLVGAGHVAPRNVLAITFTNRAAGEMRERVCQLGVPRGVTVATFHSLCARLLREFAADAGLRENYSIYDQADQVRLVRQAMRDVEVSEKTLSASRMQAAISNAKNDLIGPEEFAEHAESHAAGQIAKVYRRYQLLLQSSNALDFDDLLGRMAFLLRDRPEIRRQLGERYRYILIDEYQDTNRAQYLIAHGIGMDHRNVCATGDPDQSIYAWRGADVRNILEFENDYPEAKVVRLEENYRSTAPILASASRLIACNTRRPEKTLWTRRDGGEKVQVIECSDEEQEAERLAREIRARLEEGARGEEIAVFYRINALSRLLERACRREGIPYVIARGVEFYNRKEVKDLLAYLKVLVNPADDLSCLRIINTPARGIGATTVGRLQALAEREGTGLLAACGRADQAGLGAAATKKVRAFAEMISAFSAAPQPGVRECMEQVAQRSGLYAHYRKLAESEDEQPLANLDQLINEAAEFDEALPEGSLADYMQQVSLVADADHMEGGTGQAVTLMTLHAAKGLEFPHVYVVGCEEGVLPMIRGETTGDLPVEQLEEERRLAFVGMTRAQRTLTLTCAMRRRLRGRWESQARSRFLDELAGEDVRQQRLPGGRTTDRSRFGRGGFAGGFYEEVRQRAAIESAGNAEDSLPSWDGDFDDDAADAVPVEYRYLSAGCYVRHPSFGRGKVVRLRNRWPQTRAEVLFEGLGVKTLVLAKSNLSIEEPLD